MGRTHRTAVSVAATALRSRLTPVAQRIRISPENLLLPASVRTMATLPDKHGSYDLLAKGKLDYAGVQFAKWRSRDSGLKVVWADVESPLVHGWFSVATEIFDDTGRPHTLEHLIFMGSE